MLSSLFQSSSLPVLENVVNFTEARHGVLAGNIANLDTPGYKTRDLSPALFQQRLREAIETKNQPISPTSLGDAADLSPTDTFEQQAIKQQVAFGKVKDSMKSILRHDGDDVSMEKQVNEMMKNQQQHNLAIGIMSAQFRLLRAAITERVA
jgi:flagellar basal-body rod protein FlgB